MEDWDWYAGGHSSITTSPQRQQGRPQSDEFSPCWRCGLVMHVILDLISCPNMFSTPTPRDWLMRLIELCFGGVGGIGFYDATGFRFHLPAYMTLILRDPSTDAAHRRSSDLLMTLSDTGDFHRRYGKELSPQQKQCVRYFLLYMRAWRYLHYMCESTKIDNALAKYWVDQAKDVPEKEFWGPIWPLIRGPM